MYWLGEAHYVRRDYPAALAAFESLLNDYPGNRKTPRRTAEDWLLPGRAEAARPRPRGPDPRRAGIPGPRRPRAEAQTRLSRMGGPGG